MKPIPISKITPEQVEKEVKEWGFKYEHSSGYDGAEHIVEARVGDNGKWFSCTVFGKTKESAHRNFIRLFRREMKRIVKLHERMKA
ncbi:hypothetical protein C4565_03675 [Candidatus Parcubacteria bacterium]|nr:MAG: hypothetical protein C4565_03675 [Candidatus Parcubacteria bacterium]